MSEPWEYPEPEDSLHDDGERIARLETRYRYLVHRINHLDKCIDEAKHQTASNFAAIKNKLQAWDTRWKIALAVILTMIFVSGSGPASLKSIIELIAKLK